jgi:hypothetical protein
MNKLIKPLAMALSIGVIAFILMDKIKPEYKYYESYYGLKEITQESYEGYRDNNRGSYSDRIKKKNVYTIPLIFSIAVAVASFTFLYKTEKK